jgi:esterase/lipase
MKKVIFVLLVVSITIFPIEYQLVAQSYFEGLISKNFEKCYELSSDILKKHLPVAKLKEILEGIEQTYGPFSNIIKITSIEKSPYMIYIYTAKFQKGSLNISITINNEGKIDGLFFNIAQNLEYKAPNYVNNDNFTEKDIKVGDLPGKLTIPKNPTDVAVILIHGSGPNDMDETIGPNKIFKDIAYGLSSNNIAVLRHDKRTLHPELLKDPDNITVKEEVIDDVENAVKLLKKEGYKKIYLLGHSLGAYLAPYIAYKNQDIYGLILLAPPARNIEEITLDQLEFLEKLYSGKNKEEIKKAKEEVIKLINNKASKNEIILGAPASYWYDLRNYNPLKYIKQLKIPVLMLFGENDYQVTTKEFEIFKKELSEKKNIKIKMYSNLTHIFTPGEKSPYSYYIENQVSRKVIEDIVSFIEGRN